MLQNCLYLSYLLVHSDSKGTFLETVNYFHSYILCQLWDSMTLFLLDTDQHLLVIHGMEGFLYFLDLSK